MNWMVDLSGCSEGIRTYIHTMRSNLVCGNETSATSAPRERCNSNDTAPEHASNADVTIVREFLRKVGIPMEKRMLGDGQSFGLLTWSTKSLLC